MKKLIKILITTALILTPITIVSAEENDPIEELLLLELPEKTDNPNYNLTFTDPSEEGVRLAINGKDAIEIESPFALPSLGIGSHNLVFTFTDDEEAEKTIEKSIIIVPRPPNINPPELIDEKLILNGTGLARSEIEIFIAGGSYTKRVNTNVDTTGKWEYIIEDDLEEEVFNIIAYIRKNGYSSDFSEPISFSLEVSKINTPQDNAEPSGINFRFEDIEISEIEEIYKENSDLLIYTLSLLFIGGLFFEILKSLFSFNKIKVTKSPLSFLKRKGKMKDRVADKDTEDSLIKKFEKAGFNTNILVKSEEKKDKLDTEELDKDLNKKKKSEKTKTKKLKNKKNKKNKKKTKKHKKNTKKISKEEFLKKFEEHDPDPTPKDKDKDKDKDKNETDFKNKKLKITLTSNYKEEEDKE